MKAIMYRKFDEQGYFKCELTGKRKYTVREAMAHLEKNGFFPKQYSTPHELTKCYTNGRGISAYIV